MEKTVQKTNAKSTAVAKKNGTGKVQELPVKGIQVEPMETILQKIEKLEILKRHYGRLKYKQNDLKAALDKIQTSKLSKSDKFEEEESEEFPFVIVLKGKREYDRLEEIFTINQPETVENFTKYLLKEVDVVLEAFEKDLQVHTQNLGK